MHDLMEMALESARLSPREVRPNPRVGAAIELATGEVICAHHEYFGGPHAERILLAICRERDLGTSGSRMAITLEPCSHTGKTPPCTEALIAASVGEIIIPFADPNPLVSGQGISRLRAAGITVRIGERASDAYAMNREWLWAQKLQRPFVTLKMATSVNHVWKRAEAAPITSPAARQHAMKLRATVDIMLTSGKTIRDDDPAYTTRTPAGELHEHQPRVIILSHDLDFRPEGKIAAHPKGFESQTWSSIENGLRAIYSRDHTAHVAVEAGPTLSEAWLAAECVDEIWRYVSLENLSGMERDLTQNLARDFTKKSSERIDTANTFELWLRNDRDEKNYFNRV